MDPKVFVKGEIERIAFSARERVNLIAHGFVEKVEEVVEEYANGGYIEASGDLKEPKSAEQAFTPDRIEHLSKPRRGPGRPRKNQNDN